MSEEIIWTIAWLVVGFGVGFLVCYLICKDGDDAAAWNRLADLIEPSCDREALLALADELEYEGMAGWASGPVNVGEYARRIREACGEAVA